MTTVDKKNKTLNECETKKVKAALALDEHALEYAVTLSPTEALAFVKRASEGNGSQADFVQLIENISQRIPRMDYGSDNPNTGRFHHAFRIGNEYSRVIYFRLQKCHVKQYGEAEFTSLTADLTLYAQAAKADEFDVSNEDEHEYEFRFWWD